MAQPRTRRLVGYAGYGLLHVGFEVPRDSQVGCVAQSRTRSVGYAGYGLLHVGFEVSCNSQEGCVAQLRTR